MARATKAAAETATLQVTQVRSGIGTKPKHRATLRALGLRRIGATNTLPDRPEIRGMIARVPHLVRVESVAASTPGATPATSEEARS
ncbi:MAG TPA: 50S ribosomal protein L30 [Acidimicrobiales bacterium]|nr:50S ribosomal protein L30 [Acidimicrobiales bacterium]